MARWKEYVDVSSKYLVFEFLFICIDLLCVNKCYNFNIFVCLCLLTDVKKKLLAAGVKAANRPLQVWIKAINNHLFWSCEMSNGDPEVF